jgi:hypothetical protein
VPFNPNPNWVRQRLTIESNSVSPNFKVLIYPHHQGEELPQTNWNMSRDSLQIIFSDDEKIIHFFKNNSENTQFELVSNIVGIQAVPIKNNVNIYPNPAQCEFNIESPLIIKNIEINDSNGRLVFKNSFNNETDINIKTIGFPNGIYHLKIVVNDSSIIEESINIHCNQ